MWTRNQVKDKGKMLFRVSYWKTVLAALILAITADEIYSLDLGKRITYRFSDGSYNYQYNGHGGSFLWHGFPSMIREMFAAISDLPHAHQLELFSGAFLFSAIALVISAAVLAFGIIMKFFIFAPLEVGAKRYFVLNHYMNGNTRLDNIAYAFSNDFLNVVKTMFFKWLYIFLWSLLLVVPGIIKYYSYRMVPYILAEEPGMDMKEAFRLSEYMMEGEKWNTFVLDLSFIGWDILTALTLGVLGLFYVNPYKACTYAELYTILKTKVVPEQNTMGN